MITAIAKVHHLAIAVEEVANTAESLKVVLAGETEKEAPEEEVQKNRGALRVNLLEIIAVVQEVEIEAVTQNQKKNVSLNAEEIKQFQILTIIKKSQKFLLRFFVFYTF